MPVTDYKEFTIGKIAAPPPNLKIEDLSYPSTAKPGETVTVSWYIHNAGGLGAGEEQWTRLVDLDTGAELYKGYVYLDTCQRAGPATFKGTMPDRNWRLRVEAGYGATATSTATFQISTPTAVSWLPIIVGAGIPILFTLAVVIDSELTKKR
jgi:hypothetical protein